MSTRVVRFEAFPNMYAANPSFGKIIKELCIPKYSLRQQIISELHNEGHFGRDKILALVSFDYYWPKLSNDVAHYVERCYVCQKSKGPLTNARLYTPLPVPEASWLDMKLSIQENNFKYKAQVDSHHRQVLFDVGDFVSAVLTCDRFLNREHNKLKKQKIGLCEVR
ncbi:uncharacterized protein LOC111384520 [Olea europaea var. sylvestris]|uniref:uncharacterized protein LOC111384520 n=1 Tax=Olea europaea var. sylvestris TaxID=158386 RepID=UPI000C1D59CB|nr:uncharacterized protein LOC111384520 [Olea europaea var. sylvestris]